MTKYTASIFLTPAVFCYSSLAYPFHKSDLESDEFIPTDEGKLHQDEEREKKGPEISSDTDIEVAAKIIADLGITSRAFVVDVLIDSVKESEREGLRQTLEDAAINQQWDNIEDFIKYGLKATSKIILHSEGIKYNESDSDFSAKSSNEAKF